MPEFALTVSTLKAVATVLILLGAIYGFVSEKVPPDVVSLLIILALLLTGVLGPGDAFSGFSHPATVSVAAVLVLSSAIERTGVLSVLARRVLAPLGRSEILFTAVIMLVIAMLSAFVNNTAAVAIFIPVVLEVCRRTGASPGRVLMPMSHAATFGGMCTLMGTSTNLVAHEFARNQGLPGFSMFEIGKIGVPMLLVGFVYILLVGRWLLPRNQVAVPETIGQADPYLSELLVLDNSPWIGREVNAEHFQRDLDVELVGLVRDRRVIGLEEQRAHFAAGDSLRVRGALDKVLALAASDGLELHRPEEYRAEDRTPASALSEVAGEPDAEKSKPVAAISVADEQSAGKLQLAEVVVLTTSGLIGRTLKQIRFSERYDAVVLALRRRGGISERPSTTPLQAGDVLVIEGAPEALQSLADTRGFLVIGTRTPIKQHPRLLLITMLVLLGVVGVVTLGVLPIVTAAVAGCAVLMLTGCLPPREAYRAIDLSLVFLLAGTLALGMALEKTGITSLLANALAALTGLTGPYVVMACFFLVAVVISELMSNSGTVALLAPVAVSSAAQMGINPMALIVAIALGASASFAMPMGYQTSLMIYGPGGYRFKDFVRMGLVLDLLLAALALWLIPYYWPLIKP
ncbi:MAG: SLC13 family permease [Blastocatellia bacterium]|nr:SLC13 family permease [Blastocatellia bacterium]